MQDENTTQPTTADADISSDNASAGGEPELSLSDNPATSIPQPEPETPAQEPAATETPETPAIDDPPVYVNPPSDNASEDTGTDSSSQQADQPSADSQTSSDLESIKSSALQELMPLVNELDQEPEDKYRTLMMLIQSSDNESLIKDAYEAAEKIEDNKAKAEALLSIVNEINYLSGKTGKSEEG